MNVLFVSSEVAPFAKVGGLGDVAGALPKQLRAEGHDVRLFLPLYARVREKGWPLETVIPRASVELEEGGDPRSAILALYTEMLVHLRPRVGSVETATPEEIRATHLVRLGVRPEEAHILTRLFEEARYSTHPLGPATSAEAQGALRATLADLDRRTVPA